MEILLTLLIIFIIFEIPISIGMGIIFKKLNLEFKKGIIPFYNKTILIKYYKMPKYHLILIFIPIIGLYTNYCIYSIIAKKYNKNIIDILELTFLPFIFNIFLGLEMKQKEENIDNYFEDQKSLYTQSEEKKEEPKNEYIWYSKPKQKNNTIYKASRNSLNAKVNIKTKDNNEIIDNKKQEKKESENIKLCPNCGTKLSENTQVCYVCGTKL